MPADRSVPAVWTLVLPVQHGDRGKSRLVAPAPVDRSALARAIASDTVAAVRSCPVVRTVLLVTADPLLRQRFATGADAGPGAPLQVVPDPDAGLTAAVQAGLDAALALQPPTPVAVLLADVPALRPADLTEALVAAGRHRRAVVPDADGSGTVLLTATDGAPLHAFGAGSAARHQELGAVPLELDLPRLRRDVDTEADLRTAARFGLGPATTSVLGPDWH